MSEKRRTLRQLILKKVASMFLENKVFLGRYTDTLVAAAQWIADSNVMVQNYWHLDFDFTPVGSVSGIDEATQKIVEEKCRKMINKKLGDEQKKCVIFYVEDNFITNTLGYYRKKDHYLLTGDLASRRTRRRKDPSGSKILIKDKGDPFLSKLEK